MKIKDLSSQYEYENDLWYIENVKSLSLSDLRDGFFVTTLLDHATRKEGGISYYFDPKDTTRLIGKGCPLEVIGFHVDQEKFVTVFVRGQYTSRIKRKWSRRFIEALKWFPNVELVWKNED
jgi:hypothetical protein